MVTSNLVNLDEKIAVKVKGISASGIRKFFDLLQGMSGVISLGVGEPDFVTPAHILNAARQSIDAGHTAYTSNFGTMELRKEISKFLEGFSKTTYDPTSEILVTVGGSEANDLALRCIINPGDEIIIVEPCFVAYKPIIQISHGVPVCIPSKKENNFRPDIEAIRAAVTPKTKAIFINFPCNPSGVALTKEEAEAISEIVIENDLILISDEIYGQLTYEGEHISFPSIPGMKERTILTTGFSKAYAMTGWRMGYAAAPAPLIANMVKIHQYSMMSAPPLLRIVLLKPIKMARKTESRCLMLTVNGARSFTRAFWIWDFSALTLEVLFMFSRIFPPQVSLQMSLLKGF